MANRESVMLSHVLDLTQPRMYSLGNWFASEKLDGMRAIWLPDTKGFPVGGLPFANMDKDVKQDAKRAATGLWTRYFKPIWAPSWWLDKLPRNVFLDGELWCGRGMFNTLTSITKRKEADDRWNNVQFRVFDNPSPDQIYSDGKIHKPPILVKNFRGIWEWCKENLAYDYEVHGRGFEATYNYLVKVIDPDNSYVKVHTQERLSWSNQKAQEGLEVFLNEVLAKGGEGVIVRHPMSTWVPKRMNTVLKVKPFMDAEATIVGVTKGEGRLEGMIGALEVEGEITDAKSGRSHRATFKLGTGLTDANRTSDKFKPGVVVTYRYRELTPDGIPREGRFLRIRDDF